MSRLAAYARNAEMAGRRIAHTIATMPTRDAVSVANNAGRDALRKAIAIRLVAAETGAEVIDLTPVIEALTDAIALVESCAANEVISDYRAALLRTAA